MTHQLDLNKVQQLLFEFAKSKGMSEEQIHENWRVDYKDNAQETFEKELNDVFLGMPALIKAKTSPWAVASRWVWISPAPVQADQVNNIRASQQQEE